MVVLDKIYLYQFHFTKKMRADIHGRLSISESHLPGPVLTEIVSAIKKQRFTIRTFSVTGKSE